MKSFILITLLLLALSKKISLNPNPESLFEFVECQIGYQFEFSLKENPSTGYSWIIVEPKLGWNSLWKVAEEKY